MATPIIAETAGAKEGSTRHIKATAEFCRTLAEDFDINPRVVLECLEGEPAKQAYKVCAWVQGTEPDSIGRGRVLDSWAKKNKRGKYRPEFIRPKAKTTREMPFSNEEVWRNIANFERGRS